MKTRLALIVAGALAGAAVSAHEGHKHEEGKAAPKAETVTLTGEVIDLSCYLDHGGKGKEHQKCAKACLLEKHIPAGLLSDDGSVVLLVFEHKHEKAFAPIAGWAAERVTVTGKKASKGGLSAILVTAAQKAK